MSKKEVAARIGVSVECVPYTMVDDTIVYSVKDAAEHEALVRRLCEFQVLQGKVPTYSVKGDETYPYAVQVTPDDLRPKQSIPMGPSEDTITMIDNLGREVQVDMKTLARAMNTIGVLIVGVPTISGITRVNEMASLALHLSAPNDANGGLGVSVTKTQDGTETPLGGFIYDDGDFISCLQDEKGLLASVRYTDRNQDDEVDESRRIIWCNDENAVAVINEDGYLKASGTEDELAFQTEKDNLVNQAIKAASTPPISKEAEPEPEKGLFGKIGDALHKLFKAA